MGSFGTSNNFYVLSKSSIVELHYEETFGLWWVDLKDCLPIARYLHKCGVQTHLLSSIKDIFCPF